MSRFYNLINNYGVSKSVPHRTLLSLKNCFWILRDSSKGWGMTDIYRAPGLILNLMFSDPNTSRELPEVPNL